LPRPTRCGVAEHRNSFAEIVTAAVTIRVITASFDQMGALGRASGKRSSVRLLSFLLRVPQMQIGAKQLCKKLHILQKLSFLTTQTKGLAFGAGWQSGMELCRARPLLSNFCQLPVAVVFLRRSSHLLLFGPWSISLCGASPGFRSPPHRCRPWLRRRDDQRENLPAGRFSLLRLSSNLKICIHCKNSHP
jgi:hypothetical protein